MADRIWTISNLFSAARVLLVVPIALMLLQEERSWHLWGFALIIVAVATDFLDGFFARRLHQVSEWGKVIDPLADKIAVAIVAVVLVATGSLPLWYVVVVIGRDVLILAGGLIINRRKRIIPQSNWPGKIAVNAIALVLVLAVLEIPDTETFFEVALWGSVVLMALSVAVYARRLFIGPRERSR